MLHYKLKWKSPLITGEEELIMPKYLIEREIPGAGKMSGQELQGISKTSCGVLIKMGPEIQWVQRRPPRNHARRRR